MHVSDGAESWFSSTPPLSRVPTLVFGRCSDPVGGSAVIARLVEDFPNVDSSIITDIVLNMNGDYSGERGRACVWDVRCRVGYE